jgi:hypothetical protein
MAQKNRGLLWVALIALLLFLAWFGNQHGWWSSTKNGTQQGTNPTPSRSTTLSNFYSDVSTGESKQQVTSTSQSDNLTPSCTVTVSSPQLTQEVCVYKSVSGSGSVTVTYQNGKVTAVSKSGF